METLQKAIKSLRDNGYSVRLASLEDKQTAIKEHNEFPWRNKSFQDIKDHYTQDCYVVHRNAYFDGIYSARLLIKRAERWKIGNKSVKAYSHGGNRAKTRDIINTEDFDSIPQNQPVSEEDPWSWD
jgi:hypothetical protein